MKLPLTFRLLGCAVLITACHDESAQIAILEDELAALKSKITLNHTRSDRLRSELARANDELPVLRSQVKGLRDIADQKRAELAKLNEDRPPTTEPTSTLTPAPRTTLPDPPNLQVGMRLPLLSLGNKLYKNVLVKSFDGEIVAFQHDDGMTRLEVPDQWKITKPWVQMNSRSWSTPSALLGSTLPYSPLPKITLPKRKKARASQPTTNYTMSPYVWNRDHPRWPSWYRPIGANFEGSVLKPIQLRRD